MHWDGRFVDIAGVVVLNLLSLETHSEDVLGSGIERRW